MFDKFNLKKIEIIVIIVAIFAAGALCGYFMSKGVGPKTVNINVADIVRVNEDVTHTKEPSSNAATGDSDSNKYVAKVNINTANVDTLCALPGIGEVLAKRIIAYRTENGKFTRVEDILEVEGIGAGRYEAIREYIFI